MLAHRVIPTLLARGRTLVKGKQFQSWRSVGHVLQAARIHAQRGVDELIILDIAATPEGRGPDLDLVRALTDGMTTPVTVGGGVRSVEDVRALLRSGADKVAIGSGLFQPHLLDDISSKYGGQAVTVAIDCIKGAVAIECGTTIVGWDPYRAAKRAQNHGAGEILLTSIDREGMMDGYDLDLIRSVASAVDIPVIAHGGAGTYEHMRQAIDAGASAVAAGAMFQFTDQTPRGAAEYLREQGVEARC